MTIVCVYFFAHTLNFVWSLSDVLELVTGAFLRIGQLLQETCDCWVRKTKFLICYVYNFSRNIYKFFCIVGFN